MLRVYIPETEQVIDYLKYYKGIKEKKFYYHPSVLGEKVIDFVEKNENKNVKIFTYNTMALKFIPHKYLYWVDKDNRITKLDKKFPYNEFYPIELCFN